MYSFGFWRGFARLKRLEFWRLGEASARVSVSIRLVNIRHRQVILVLIPYNIVGLATPLALRKEGKLNSLFWRPAQFNNGMWSHGLHIVGLLKDRSATRSQDTHFCQLHQSGSFSWPINALTQRSTWLHLNFIKWVTTASFLPLNLEGT